MIYLVIYPVSDSFLNNSTVMFYRYFREIEITNLFFRKNRLHVTMNLYETRVESLLITVWQNWKKGLDKLCENINQLEKNNNLNADPKIDKIVKDTINASKLRNSKKSKLCHSKLTNNFLRKQSRLKNHKTHEITSHGSVI